MNSGTIQNRRLRILQLNLNKSVTAHLDLINRDIKGEWDIVCIQELHITKYGHIQMPSGFRQVIPSSQDCLGIGKVRSVIWVNHSMNTNNWEIVNIPDTNDITVIKMRGEFGTLAIFNVYNPCNSNNTQNRLDRFLDRKQAEFYGNENKHIIWSGDFTCHHPMWDWVQDVNLFRGGDRERTDQFIQILADHDMVIALPRDIPTLCHLCSRRYTRPDNVFMTNYTLTYIARCNVEATWRPTNTDHFPVVTILEMPMERTTPMLTQNFRMMAWEEFRRRVEERLPELWEPGEANTVSNIDEQVQTLTKILQETIVEVVPMVKTCPHMKRW
jgi:exonuclease III